MEKWRRGRDFFAMGRKPLTQKPGDAGEDEVEAGSVWLKQEV